MPQSYSIYGKGAETSALKVKQSSYINLHFHPLETSRTIKVEAFTLNTLFLPLTLTQKGKSFFRVISLVGEREWVVGSHNIDCQNLTSTHEAFGKLSPHKTSCSCASTCELCFNLMLSLTMRNAASSFCTLLRG